ncbi:MAG: gamma-glutamyltransferase [Chloroherpetonaceae bacterium]|nr:gamma-glutamyltransferase [Chloroherpetonaceae bacterium]
MNRISTSVWVGLIFSIFILYTISISFVPGYSSNAAPISRTSMMSQPTYSKNGMVVSSHPIASKVGVEILQKGGNAIDAAVATEFALAVVFPSAGNIGGGGFLLVRQKNGEVAALDYREKAPIRATRDMFLDSLGNVNIENARFGALSVGVPGTVAGMVELNRRYGKLPFAKLLQPAIELAEKGFVLSYEDADLLNRHLVRFSKYASTREYFVRSKPWEMGDLLVQKDLAQTLKLIAKKGRDGFYKGRVADLIVEEMKRSNGIISHLDLEQYQPQWRIPLKSNYRGFTVYAMPPPSSGGVILLSLLKMIEPYPIKEYGYNSSKSIHLFSEAMKRVYADRAEYLGDPDFVQVPIDALLNPKYLLKRMSTYDSTKASPSENIKYGKIESEPTETTHYSVIDSEGNAVSATTTLNGSFGSNLVVGGAGFFLNNEMDDFSAKAGAPNLYQVVGSSANAIAPEKRMLSSMTPTIITQGDSLFLIVGTRGGSRIPTQVFQSIINVIDFEMNIQDAVSFPRFHHQWQPDLIFYEPNGLSNDVIDQLIKMGWKLQSSSPWGSINAIQLTKEGLKAGGADSRFQNKAFGY